MCSGLAVLVACGCMTPVMTFGKGKSATEAQRDTMGDLMPAQLAIESSWSGEVSVQKIRVWADTQYRAQNLRWQQAFQELLDYANAVMAPAYGVRFVAEYQTWEYHAPGATLEDTLTALAARDPGDDVFTVVGLTSALALVSATFDQLGLGTVGGRHLVLRGYADLAEREAFERLFPDLEADEREHVLEARRRHKTAATLLHELGHNLGVEHDTEPDTIMHATYSHHSATFTAAARQVMRGTLARRLGRDTGEPGTVLTAGVAPAPAPPPQLVVYITPEGKIAADGKFVEAAALEALFAATAAKDRDTEIVIKKARKAPSSIMIDVVDKARAAGLSKIAVGTQ